MKHHVKHCAAAADVITESKLMQTLRVKFPEPAKIKVEDISGKICFIQVWSNQAVILTIIEHF